MTGTKKNQIFRKKWYSPPLPSAAHCKADDLSRLPQESTLQSEPPTEVFHFKSTI